MTSSSEEWTNVSYGVNEDKSKVTSADILVERIHFILLHYGAVFTQEPILFEHADQGTAQVFACQVVLIIPEVQQIMNYFRFELQLKMMKSLSISAPNRFYVLKSIGNEGAE